MQIELLKSYVKQPIIVNQMQFSIMHTGMVNSGIQANTLFEDVFVDNNNFPELNIVLGRVAAEKGVSKSAIAVVWILRHPAKMQTIVGKTNTKRLKDICTASRIELSRED